MDEHQVDRDRASVPQDAVTASEGSSRRGIAGLLPDTGPTWWEVAAAAVAIAFAAHRFAITTFYGPLGVSPEEVGVGTTSALEGTVFLLAVLLIVNGALAYLYALLFGGNVLGLWNRIKALSKVPERGRLLATMFVIHRVVVVVSIIGFVTVLGSIDGDRQLNVGPWEPEVAALVVLGFIAFWVAMAVVNQRFAEVEATSERDGTAVRRAAGRFTTATLVVIAIVSLAAPTFLAHRDANTVKDGHAVSRNLYQATQVIVTPIDVAADVLRETTSHCLLYLGNVNGITVLYDADSGATVRLPSSQVIVIDPQHADRVPEPPCG